MRYPTGGIPMLALLLMLAACHGPQGEPASSLAPPAQSVEPVEVARLAPLEGPPPAQAHDACNLEDVSAGEGGAAFRAPVAATVRARGWITDAGRKGRAAAPALRLYAADASAAWSVDLSTIVDRPDVAAALGEPGAAAAGFSQSFSIDGLPPGDYKLLLVARTDGGFVACDNGRILTVDP